MLPLRAENRQAAGVAAGDEVTVQIELDTEPREITVPEDVSATLDQNPAARQYFFYIKDQLADKKKNPDLL